MFYQSHKRSLQISLVFFLVSSISVAAQNPESLVSANVSESPAIKKNIRQGDDFDSSSVDLGTIELWKSALVTDPGNPITYNNLATAYARQKNFEQAVPLLERAVELKPDFVNALYNLGVVYDSLERFPEALATIQKAVRLDPENVLARTELCQLHLVTENFKEAIPCYEFLVKMKSPDLRTRNSLGMALFKAQQYEKAISLLQENIALFPNDAVSFNTLGMVWFQKKKYKEADGMFRRALEIQPDLEMARFNLAVTQLVANDRASALKQYAQLKRTNSVLADSLYKIFYRDKVIYANK